MNKFVLHLRTALRMTQADFAEYVGVSLDTVKSWESGRRNPTKYLGTLYYMIDNPRISHSTRDKLEKEWYDAIRSKT